MTYPTDPNNVTGRVLYFDYDDADQPISRVTKLADGARIEFYSYLGLGTVVERRYNDDMVRQSYIKLSGEDNGDAGDQYAGLDRFGRVVRQRWLDDADEGKGVIQH